MDLRTKEATIADAEEIVSFHNAAYGDSQKPEHWMWEYRGHYPNLSVFAVITDAERIIATQGMIPVYINVGGRRVLSGKSENTLSNPDYRGKGVFQGLYEFAVSMCKLKGMQCVWGFSSSDKALNVLRKCQFRIYERMMYTAISITSLRYAPSEILEQGKAGLKERVLRFVGFSLLWLYASLFRVTCRVPDKGFLVREDLVRQQDLDDLYQHFRQVYPGLIHVDLNAEYLHWRVYGHPIFKYKTYFVYEGDVLRAYAFVNAHNRRHAYLTDFTFESVSAGKVLIQRVLRDMRAEDVGVVTFFGNQSNPAAKKTFELLRKFGFVKRGWTYFVLRNISFEDERSLFDPTHWYMNGLWTEGYEM